ncbi:MAG TPA: hypothetical protein DEB35_10725 [Desulfuromonas sp.]|nr:hypothetical protein [Desulfuromonas sp.]HBT83834.1 hypothetical protein [Desulfuromonas sp.]
MSDNSRAIVPIGQQGVVASVSRQLAITEKLLTKLRTGRALSSEMLRPKLVVQNIESLAISPNGALLLTGSGNNLYLWDMTKGNLSRVLKGHSGWVNTVSFSPDGHQAISGSSDKTVRLWDIRTGDCKCYSAGNKVIVNKVYVAAISPDGNSVYCSGILLLNLITGDYTRKFGYQDYTIEALAISPDGCHLLSGGFDKNLTLWDVISGACTRVFKKQPSVICAVAFSPDGFLCLSGGEDSTLRLWHLGSGECLRIFEGHSSCVKSVEFSSDSLKILSGSQDGMLRLWDVETGECINIFEGHTGVVEDVSFTNNSRHVVSGGSDGTIRFWNVETAAETARCYGFDDGTWAVVAPDGRYDASNDGDCPHLYWTVGLSNYPATHYKSRVYTPGLLPMLLGKADHNPVM